MKLFKKQSFQERSSDILGVFNSTITSLSSLVEEIQNESIEKSTMIENLTKEKAELDKLADGNSKIISKIHVRNNRPVNFCCKIFKFCLSLFKINR